MREDDWAFGAPRRIVSSRAQRGIGWAYVHTRCSFTSWQARLGVSKDYARVKKIAMINSVNPEWNDLAEL